MLSSLIALVVLLIAILGLLKVVTGVPLIWACIGGAALAILLMNPRIAVHLGG